MKELKYVAVVFGGVSQEHDVSVLTGVLTLNCLDKRKYSGVPIYIDKSGRWYTGDDLNKISFFKNFDGGRLKRVTLVCGDGALYYERGGSLKKMCDIACAINCLHGRNGEDGSLAGVMKMCGVPLASPDVFSASASMDKGKTKSFLLSLGVPVVHFAECCKRDFFADEKAVVKMMETEVGYPAIVKPSKSGSSIGISVVNDDNELIAALIKGFSYDESCLVERFLKGASDINCAAYRKGGKICTSECERPISKSEFLSFADKYSSSKFGATREFPAKIDRSLSDKIKSITEKVYGAFGFSGIIRVDYLIRENEIYLNEINGCPGSLAYYLFCEKFADFSVLLDEIIKEGISERVAYDNCSFDFSSDILSFCGVALKK